MHQLLLSMDDGDCHRIGDDERCCLCCHAPRPRNDHQILRSRDWWTTASRLICRCQWVVVVIHRAIQTVTLGYHLDPCRRSWGDGWKMSEWTNNLLKPHRVDILNAAIAIAISLYCIVQPHHQFQFYSTLRPPPHTAPPLILLHLLTWRRNAMVEGRSRWFLEIEMETKWREEICGDNTAMHDVKGCVLSLVESISLTSLHVDVHLPRHHLADHPIDPLFHYDRSHKIK